MFNKDKLDQRVGRIPSGYAAYEAEAVELYWSEEGTAKPEIGALAVEAAVEVNIAS